MADLQDVVVSYPSREGPNRGGPSESRRPAVPTLDSEAFQELVSTQIADLLVWFNDITLRVETLEDRNGVEAPAGKLFSNFKLPTPRRNNGNGAQPKRSQLGVLPGPPEEPAGGKPAAERTTALNGPTHHLLQIEHKKTPEALNERRPPAPVVKEPRPSASEKLVAKEDTHASRQSLFSGAEVPDNVPYEPKESVWDACLYVFDGHDSWCQDFAAFCGLVANAFLQLALTYFIQENMAAPQITTDTLKGNAIWRATVGHHIKYYDELTNTSLAARVCSSEFGAGTMSNEQRRTYGNAATFLPMCSFGDCPWQWIWGGPGLCVMVVCIYLLEIAKELQDATVFAFAAIFGRKARKGFEDAEDSDSNTEEIPCRRKIFVAIVVVIRFLTVVWFGYTGMLFILGTDADVGNLIKDALALQFVLGVDELLYNFAVSERRRSILAEMEITVPPKVGKGRISSPVLKTTLFTIFVLAPLATAGVDGAFMFSRRINVLLDSRDILCGGDTNFVFSQDSATGVVQMATTAGIEDPDVIRGGFSFQPVITRAQLPQDAGWARDWMRAEFADYPRGLPIWSSVQVDDVLQSSKLTSTEAADALGCFDLDEHGAFQTALHHQVVDRNASLLAQGEVLNCAQVADLCEWAEVRTFCPTTCRCETMGQGRFNRQGCSSQCNANVSREIYTTLQNSKDSVCEDFPLLPSRIQEQVETLWWVRYFRELEQYLIESDRLSSINGSDTVQWSDTFKQQLADSSYQAFDLVDVPVNLTAWAEAAVKSNFSTPCKIIPWVAAIFEYDLCLGVDLRTESTSEETTGLNAKRGILRGLCQKTCTTHCGAENQVEQRETMTWAEVHTLSSAWGLEIFNMSVLPEKQGVLFCNGNVKEGTVSADDEGEVLFEVEINYPGEYNFQTCNAGTDFLKLMRLESLEREVLAENGDSVGECTAPGTLNAKFDQELDVGTYNLVITAAAMQQGSFTVVMSCPPTTTTTTSSSSTSSSTTTSSTSTSTSSSTMSTTSLTSTSSSSTVSSTSETSSTSTSSMSSSSITSSSSTSSSSTSSSTSTGSSTSTSSSTSATTSTSTSTSATTTTSTSTSYTSTSTSSASSTSSSTVTATSSTTSLTSTTETSSSTGTTITTLSSTTTATITSSVTATATTTTTVTSTVSEATTTTTETSTVSEANTTTTVTSTVSEANTTTTETSATTSEANATTTV